MLENVLYDRKNMMYEELLDYVTRNRMLVICCIDAHFTAFRVIDSRPVSLLYYDPLRSGLRRVSGDGYRTLAAFLLLKCNYGDGQHLQDNRDYYTGLGSNNTRQMIYRLWRRINSLNDVSSLHGVTWKSAPLKLDRYLLVNGRKDPRLMSTQRTGNTCYFQTYLFAVLCKVCEPCLASDGTSVELHNIDALERATEGIARFLLGFFAEDHRGDPGGGSGSGDNDSDNEGEGKGEGDGEREGRLILRPLTNSNFVVDFYRHTSSPYYFAMTEYLTHLLGDGKRRSNDGDGGKGDVVNYGRQYQLTMDYYKSGGGHIHGYERFTHCGSMSSIPNAKSLRPVTGTDGAVFSLARYDYYRYRAVNLMFGFNSGIMHGLRGFCEFNALRKNQLLRFYDDIGEETKEYPRALAAARSATKYRDYYFMPQFEVGQRELVDVHHHTYLIDLCSMSDTVDPALMSRVRAVNRTLADHVLFSTQKRSSYDKFLKPKDFQKSKKLHGYFLDSFMSPDFLSNYVGLGFADVNPKEKEINSLTQTVFYATDLMRVQANRQEYEFEKECINQMARSTLRKYLNIFEGDRDMKQGYRVTVKIGHGHTYSKYNTLMHFLNVVKCYWRNPDLSNVQVFGKDIRALLAISCQKIFFGGGKGANGHGGFYHYGPFEVMLSAYRSELDLAVATSIGLVAPTVSRRKNKNSNQLIISDRVYEYGHLKDILKGILDHASGIRFKSDNEVLNLCLLSLMLDLGLYESHAELLNLPFLRSLRGRKSDTRELQVEVANLIYDFDRKNRVDSVTRSKVEGLLFEVSYKFLVNKNFPVQSEQFRLIHVLNSDPDYQSYVLLCKVYMSLCQINRSVEVDYYKVRCDGEFRIVIPSNYSKTTGEYLDTITRHHTFSEREGFMVYDGLSVFDLRPHQPEINLHKVRFDSTTKVQSMVKYIEIENVFRVIDSELDRYLVFVADNVLLVDIPADGGDMAVSINGIGIEVATIFFNETVSFIPCFKYRDSEDVILFASKNINFLVDQGGQFSTDYYGMKHELIDCINSEEVVVDLNDEHVFKSFKLSDLLTESKTVVYYPNYLLQVSDRKQLINLLDLALRIRNVSFFILVLFFLQRGSVVLQYIEKEEGVTKISGPWKEAILYVLNRTSPNPHYDSIFGRQFFDLNQYEGTPLRDFIKVLCDNFTKYQRYTEDGHYQIVPTEKQKTFLEKIIRAEECFHFSEVGSGKTKVILPLLCQVFLSNNAEAHVHLARGGKPKDILVILVPEHLVRDARSQVFRYCLNLNFREEYRIYDDIFALLHSEVQPGAFGGGRSPMKQIFVTSFNQFKKALTYDVICSKVWSHRERILVVADEVDDFLDRDKLVFNICSNKNNAFDKPTLDLFFEVSRAAYQGRDSLNMSLESLSNPDYWKRLFQKFQAIHTEIQDASRSINKSFGIFNEQTLRHCSTNIVHDIEGYKSLIARPYESVNRAMPGSYYSDVERTIYLTYVILTEDISKYDELFQAERKFISFEYWNSHFVHQLDYDDLVYGHEKLSEIVDKHKKMKDGLARFLYEIILRRMEIRDKSRSVSSIDIIFNFDCIGFTGTPFLDNYPTFKYIREHREDDIPNLIDRSFYAYTSDALPLEEFEERFAHFQGRNQNVIVDYVSSDFVCDSLGEMEILESIFEREEQTGAPAALAEEVDSVNTIGFNVIVDLCGIFKCSSIHDVCDLIKSHLGSDHFHYIYHIDQADNSDRVLCINSGNDVQFDEEFYKHMCKTYGADLRYRIFFFVDNRNVIGKDIPFQLIYQRHFGLPLFTKSVVLAHDVNDFSKIWQAMGRSRTMNETVFSIYKSGIPDGMVQEGMGAHDIKRHPFTRLLYVQNCDCKMAGNISSIYLTLVALFNLSQKSFYYCDEIVNTFLEKMEKTISRNVIRHEDKLVRHVLGTPLSARILLHILVDKFRRSSNEAVAREELSGKKVEMLLRQIVKQKFEQRMPSFDMYDHFISFLSGQQKSLMEITYTKQQQKQKQKQQNKNQDSDAMGIFDKKNQLTISIETEDYFLYTQKSQSDLIKTSLNLPISVPILSMTYDLDGRTHTIDVFPTIQFLYSHHIHSTYITQEVQSIVKTFNDPSKFYARFLAAIKIAQRQHTKDDASVTSGDQAAGQLKGVKIKMNKIRQNPQYTIAALQKGLYVIGMKDQFNIYDLQDHPMYKHIQYVIDDMGFVLYDKTASRSIDSFGPYFIEQYIMMELLSKHEVAQNVMDYYCNHKETIQCGLKNYDESQGKGFICWRFLINDTAKAAIQSDDDGIVAMDETGDESPPKRSKVGCAAVTNISMADADDQAC